MLRGIDKIKTIRSWHLFVAPLLVMVGLFVFGPVDTVLAAPYPGKLCSARYNSTNTAIHLSCSDNKDNGSLDGAVYKKDGREFKFTDVRSGTGNFATEKRCNSKITIASDKTASITGEYVVLERVSGSVSGSALRATCKKIDDPSLDIDANGARISAFMGTFKDSMKDILAESCPNAPVAVGSDAMTPQQCQFKIAQAVNTCGENIDPRFARQDDSKQTFQDAYKTALTRCVRGSTHLNGTGITAREVNEAANGSAAAAKAKSEGIRDTAGAGEGEEGDEDKTQCAIDGVGWIICPVMVFMANLNDAAFGFINNFLEIPASLITDKATQNAWETFRDIANVMFVIAFMFIVYSQVTGAGISNYGIKKMLPRIVIAAILVNLSYIICSILVDISNIAGSSIYDLLKSIEVSGGAGAEPNKWDSIVAGILATGAIIALFAIVIIAPFSLLAFALVVLILIARQALVILLVVLSPVAFVLYLLPNTEEYFKKWWNALKVALLVYPIIGAVFGVCYLASNILMSVAGNNGNAGGGDDDNLMLAIIALGVMAIPLFAVPALLKGSMSAAGSVGARLANLQDRANRGSSKRLGDRTKQMAGGAKNFAYGKMLDKAKNYNGNSRRGRALATAGGWVAGRSARREQKYASLEEYRKGKEEEYLRQEGTSSDMRAQRAEMAKKDGDLAKTASSNRAAIGHLQNPANAAAYTAAGMSGEELKDREAAQKADITSQYLSGQGAGLRAQAVGAQQTAKLQEKTIEDNAERAHIQDPANHGLYNARAEAKGDLKNAELAHERDFEGSTTGARIAQEKHGIDGDLEVIRGEHKNAFEGSPQGQTLAIRKDAVAQQSATIKDDNEATALIANEAVHIAADAASVRKSTAQKKVQTQATYDNADLRIEEDAAKSGLSVAESTVEGLTYVQNEGAHIEAQAAKDVSAAAKSGQEALIDELRTGTQEVLIQNPQYAQEYADLTGADIQKRVQTQRGAIAKKIAGQEYAAKIGKPGQSTTYATEAAGIGGAQAVSQVQAVAKQTMLGALREGITAEKVTMSETPHESYVDPAGNAQPGLIDIVKDTSQSLERRAAAAGMIASAGYRDGHLELIEYLADTANRPDAAADPGGYEEFGDIQQAAFSDMKSMPTLMGNTERGDMDKGRLGVVPRVNPVNPGTRVSIREELMLRRLEAGKVSEQSIASLDPDEVKIIGKLHDDGILSTDARANFNAVMDRLRTNPQAYQPAKQAQRAVFDRVYPPTSTP